MSRTRLLGALAALILASSAASALTVVNNGSKEIAIGVDGGATESVHSVPAGKSVAITDVCVEGCGVTGPWGFSYMARSADNLVVMDGALTIGEDRLAVQHADSCWTVQRWIGLCEQ